MHEDEVEGEDSGDDAVREADAGDDQRDTY